MDGSVNLLAHQFPALAQSIDGQPLVYLDNAATTQKPQAVIDALTQFYQQDNANVHRAGHQLGLRATAALEHARAQVARYLGAADAKQIVFTRGTTEALNLLAYAFPLRAGDEVIVSELEHHANLVPWQLACQARGASLVIWRLRDGALQLDDLAALISSRSRLLSLSMHSNVLGQDTPYQQALKLAKQHGLRVALDGAQAVADGRLTLDELGCDYFACSAHKMYGPLGIGALYGSSEALELLTPWQGGGEMIREVTLERSCFAPLPHRLEAGTPAIADAVAWGAAIDWLLALDESHWLAAQQCCQSFAQQVALLPGVTLLGQPQLGYRHLVSLSVAGHHVGDIAALLDAQGVMVRAGSLCAQPLHRALGLTGSLRFSFALYNHQHDVQRALAALTQALQWLEE